MRNRSVIGVAFVSAVLGAVMWERLPLRSAATEVVLLGLWLTWVLVATTVGAALVPTAHHAATHLIRWRPHRPLVERRVLLALVITAPTALLAGGVVGFLG
jgi:hypothetical protein